MSQLSYTYSEKLTNILYEQNHDISDPKSLGCLAEEIEKLKVEINDYLTDRVKIEAEEKKKKNEKLNEVQAHKTKKQKVDN